jgi:hypothetical protein
MTIKLTDLELEEVSLVDAGDDPMAKVSIFKRKPEGEEMTEETQEIETVDKSAEMQEQIDLLKAENERLRKALIENEFVIREDSIEKKAPEEIIEFEGEMIAKSAIPTPILKKLEEMEKAAEVTRLEKRGKEELPNLKGTDLEKGMLLKAVDGLDNKDALLQTLKAADALFAKMTEEVGKEGNQGDMLSAQEKLDQMVKTFQKEKNCSYAKAYQEAAKTKEGKALIQATYKGE